jgi:hypothetical protein
MRASLLGRIGLRRGFVAFVGFTLVCVAQAGTLSPTARVEIDTLLKRLEASGCQFNRNGSWYPGPEARAHLQRKLEYLEDKGLVDSAEQFIERGATQSSMTGRAYLVKCAGQTPVASRTWLTAQLQAIRAAGVPRSSP